MIIHIIKRDGRKVPFNVEKIANAIDEHLQQIKQQLLDNIMSNHPDFFEQLVVELLLKMGYGYDKKSGIVIGGIVGLILFIIIILSGLSSNFFSISIFTLYKFIILLGLSVLGGIVGVNKKDKIRIK